MLKGDAGTGKTTLALQLIEELSEEQPDYYLSTRVSDEALYNQFPWVKDRAKRDNVLKAGKAFLKRSKQGGEDEADQKQAALKAAKDLLRALTVQETSPMVARTELQKLEGQVESGELGSEDETRFLGELTEDAVTLDLGILLPELEVAYDLSESNLPKKTLIIIDSIDALSERYGIPSSRLINTLQKDLVESSSMNVVYTLEQSGKSPLDYLGDGVIVLTQQDREGRRLRQMIIEKLRGQAVSDWKYTFTLQGGRLTVFRPTWVKIPEKMQKHVSIKDPSATTVSSGNPNFDQFLGGLPRGSLTLFEFDVEVHQDVVRTIGLSLISDFLSKGRGVVWLPSYATNYELIDAQLKMLVGKDPAYKSFRILDASKEGEVKFPFVREIEGSDVTQDLRSDSLKYMLSEASTPYLSMLGFDSMEATYGQEVFKNTLPHIDAMRRSGNVVVAVASTLTKSLGPLREQSKMHIKFENISGRVMACGQKPFSPYFYLEFPEDDKLPGPRFIPMV